MIPTYRVPSSKHDWSHTSTHTRTLAHRTLLMSVNSLFHSNFILSQEPSSSILLYSTFFFVYCSLYSTIQYTVEGPHLNGRKLLKLLEGAAWLFETVHKRPDNFDYFPHNWTLYVLPTPRYVVTVKWKKETFFFYRRGWSKPFNYTRDVMEEKRKVFPLCSKGSKSFRKTVGEEMGEAI